MRRRPTGPDLVVERVELDADGTAAPVQPLGGRNRRRWPWAVGAIVAALAIVAAGPGRTYLIGREYESLAHRFGEVTALETQRQELMNTIGRAAPPSDRALAVRTDAALYAQEIVRLEDVDRQMAGQLTVGGGLAHLRRTMESGIGALVANLRAVRAHGLAAAAAATSDGSWSSGSPEVPEPGPAAQARLAQADRLLVADGHRLHQPLPATVGGRMELTAAVPTLAKLHHLLDGRPPITLAVPAPTGLTVLDLHSNRAGAIALGSGAATWAVARRGWLAVQAGGRLWAVPPGAISRLGRRSRSTRTRSPGPVDLGPASEIMAAARPDTVWVAQPSGGRTVAVEVDRSGRPLAGPTALPPRTSLAGVALTQGLVLAGDRGFLVWDPESGRIRHLPPACALAVAGQGSLFAWTTCWPDPVLHVTNLATGVDRVVAAPAGSAPAPIAPGLPDGAFSPDGRTLAVPWQQASSAGTGAALGLVDVASGRIAIRPLPTAAALDVVSPATTTWAPSGRWVFFASSDLTGFPLAAYRMGSAGAVDLRYRDPAQGNAVVGLAALAG